MVFSPEMFSPYFSDNYTTKCFNAIIGGGYDSSRTSDKCDLDAMCRHLQNFRQGPLKAYLWQTSHCQLSSEGKIKKDEKILLNCKETKETSRYYLFSI